MDPSEYNKYFDFSFVSSITLVSINVNRLNKKEGFDALYEFLQKYQIYLSDNC